MNKKSEYPVLAPVVLVLAFLLIVGSIWVGKSHFEARVYNRLTDSSVSTFDAMFVQLRINSQ